MADVCLDPFGQHGNRGPKSISPVFPDGDPSQFVSLTLTADATFSGATATSGLITIVPPNQADGGGIEVTYSTDADDLSTTPLNYTYTVNKENTVALAIITHHKKKIRPVMSGLRVVAISSPDNTSGILDAFFSRTRGRSAVAVPLVYSSLAQEPDGVLYTVAEGITTRGYIDDSAFSFTVAPADQYAAAGVEDGLCRRPVVRFRGLAAGTTLSIQMVYHVQVETTGNLSPVLSSSRTSSQFEPELKQLIHYINQKPHTSKGNSFGSFFKAIGQGFMKVFHFVERNIKPITSIVKYAAPLVTAMA